MEVEPSSQASFRVCQMIRVPVLLAAISLGCLPAPAIAQFSEGPRKSERLHDLLEQGFEIKAVMASPTGPRVILQKGAAIYNCDGRKLGADIPSTEPNLGVGLDRGLCFTVTFR